MSGIIQSILDNDLYSFTQRKAIAQHYPGTPVRFEFINRRPTDQFDQSFLRAFNDEIQEMSRLKLTKREDQWLRTECPYLGDEFVNSLSQFSFDPKQVEAEILDGQLLLSFEGSWENTLLWEVPAMAIICELFANRQDSQNPLDAGWGDRAIMGIRQKAKTMSDAGIRWSDFGTRRRRYSKIQDHVVDIMSTYAGFQGTSNPFLAMKYGVKPIGTMSHQWIMGVSVLEGMRHANRHAMNKWAETFHGDLGIALTDTFGTNAFWDDFDTSLAKLFDGVRHDSGDPFHFGQKAIDEYSKRKINPEHKTAVFSDGLNVEKVLRINERFRGLIGLLFGIGTHLTNDVDGRQAMNIVIKLVRCGGIPTVKLGDDYGKETGDKEAVRVARWTFKGIPLDCWAYGKKEQDG